MTVVISDAEWKKIETSLSPKVSNTGAGAYLRDYEKAMTKLHDLGATDAAHASGAAAKDGMKQADAAWNALMKADGAITKLVKAEKLPVNTPEYKHLLEFTNALFTHQHDLMGLERQLKTKV